MNIEIDLQIAVDDSDCPTQAQFETWAEVVLAQPELVELLPQTPQLSLRLVDAEEGAALNQQWRAKTGATNVLSFPFEPMAGMDLGLLGDIVLCVPVVKQEALQQHKTLISHFAHLLIHGMLHLLGFDHIDKQDAVQMETLEIKIMTTLGYNNPYA